MALVCGIDLVEIDRLAGLAPAIRLRFIQRVFTPAEMEESGGSNASLAGKFAAKEAVAKALGCGIGRAAWREIEVLKDSAGRPGLHLHGGARQEAERLGLAVWSVSISHTRNHAAAVAIAQGSLPAV